MSVHALAKIKQLDMNLGDFPIKTNPVDGHENRSKRADATKRCQRHGRVPYETKRPNGEERKEQRAD
jgi:hypothetical protein